MHIVFALATPAETGAGGGSDYIAGLAGGLRETGVQVDILFGTDPVFPAGSVPVVDGMLLPALYDRLDELARSDAVVLVHHVAAAAGRDEASRDRVRAVEQIMLPRLRRVVATSLPVAHRLEATFGIVAHALPPGMRDHPPASPEPDTPVILSLGVLTRRKGFEQLIRASARLVDLPWQLIIAGDTQRDPGHAAELRALASELGLTSRLLLVPDPTAKVLDDVWRRATIFALATRWEGYPSAVAEALQRGIPILVTDAANADGFLPAAAGAICPLDDMVTFGKCLRRLLYDDALRGEMAEAARAAGQTLPRWPDRAREFVAFLEQSA